MTPKQLRRAGEALFGPYWRKELADALGVGYRTPRRWEAGQNPIPASAAEDIRKLLEARGIVVQGLLDELSDVGV